MSERAMYLALGLEPGAPSEEIKRAYRNLSLRLHPDASGDPSTARRFSMVAKAYETLRVKERDRPTTPRPLEEPGRADLFALGVELSTHPDPARRKAAARRLGLSGKRSAWVFLRKGLYDGDEEVAAACVRAAAVLGLAQGAGEIADAYQRGGPGLRDAMLDAARATRDPLFAAAIEVARTDDDPRRRSIACRLAMEAGPSAAASARSEEVS